MCVKETLTTFMLVQGNLRLVENAYSGALSRPSGLTVIITVKPECLYGVC
jgi:hypothetical protein